MSGSVYRYVLKDGTTVRWGWVLDLAPTIDPETGRQKRSQARKQGFRRKIDAEHALAEEQHGLVVGTALSLADRKITVSEFAGKWMASKIASGKWRPTSAQSAEVLVRLYLVPALGRAKLSEVGADDIRRLLTRAAGGKLGSRRPLGPRSVNQLRTLVSAMFAQAARERLVSWNPASATDPVRIEAEPVQPWTTSERDAFLALVGRERPDLYGPLTLMAHTGIRRGEAAALTWARVDLDNRRLRVEATAIEVGGQQRVGPPKSERSRRTVPFGASVEQVLRSHRRQQAADRLAAPAWQDGDLVLCEADGSPMPLYRLTVTFGKLAAAAGLPGSLHILRHTSVCVMLRSGVPPLQVAQCHGHSLMVMTQTYSHYIPDELNQWADRAEAHRDAF